MSSAVSGQGMTYAIALFLILVTLLLGSAMLRPASPPSSAGIIEAIPPYVGPPAD